MNKKIKSLVYELSNNARISTKDLGKKLKVSQQAASYLINSLQEKKTILSYSTLIDPSKFGYLQVQVYVNFFDFSKRKDIINYLKEEDHAVHIEELSQGYDLSVIFSVPNLSYYNKLVRDFLQKFKGSVNIAETYPIVAKHIYLRKYLAPRKQDHEIVIAGDRDVEKLGLAEMSILGCLWENANQKIIEIHKKTNLNPKTIVKTKKFLEMNKIIRGYETNFDLTALNITKKHILLNSKDLSFSDDKKLLQFSLMHNNIVSLTRFIGDYDLLIEVEEEENSKKNVLNDLRMEFPIKRYMVIGGGTIIKQKYIPKHNLFK
jgi:DNA-binding Lrp family transcriptional regulator